MQHIDLLIQLISAGLVVSFGSELEQACDPAWLKAIERATIQEAKGLLFVSKDDAARAVTEHRVILVHEREGGAFVACVFLHPVVDGWLELGTVYVVPHWRYSARKLPISQALHRLALELFEDDDFMVTETSTVAAIVHGAERNGFHLVNFGDLPEHVQGPTCCCPGKKTGAPDELDEPALRQWNVKGCPLRDRTCNLLVGPKTYAYLLRLRGGRVSAA